MDSAVEISGVDTDIKNTASSIIVTELEELEATLELQMQLTELVKCNTSVEWKSGLIQLHKFTLQNSHVRTDSNRTILIEFMNCHILVLKEEMLWTRELGVLYANILREFTTLRSIVRAMQGGIGMM
jgi:hypothetical protein